jgi:CheY-like chemotaxis protein
MSSPTSQRVLAVEDNPETQLLLQHLLRPSFEVVTADSVDEALACSEDGSYHLLLLDINLGEKRTGVDLLDLLRNIENVVNVPAIALTAYAMPGDRDSFIEAGFDAYVSKPFTRDDLMSTINRVLGSTEAE